MDNVVRSIECASVLDPAYGVFHAGNTDIPEIFHRRYTRPSTYVLDAFCEMVNTVTSRFPKGEPPFRLLFENLWWPGLRLTDDSDFVRIQKKVEFENWGICLDTGHLMNCLPTVSEQDGIERLLKIFGGYREDLIDRITDVHFHWSASYEYRETFRERDPGDSIPDFITEAYPHVSRIDNHLPFSDPRCGELLDILRPEYVAHEMPGSEKGIIEDFVKQRSLLP